MDSKGYLWCITNYGLSRFDGVNFKNFFTKDGLPQNDIFDLVIDKQDNVWLAFKTSLYRYNNSTESIEHITFANSNIKAHKIVYDSSSNLIYTINAIAYNAINATTLQVKIHALNNKAATNSDAAIAECLLDSKHKLWIPIERHGLYCINTTNHAEQYSNKVTWPLSLHQTIDGTIYCSTWQNGAHKIKYTSDTSIDIQPLAISKAGNEILYACTQAPQISGTDILWFAYANTGVAQYSIAANKIIKKITVDPNNVDGLKCNDVINTYVDKFGNLWLCSWNGLMKISPQEQQFFSRTEPNLLRPTSYDLISSAFTNPVNAKQTIVSYAGGGLEYFDAESGVSKAIYFSPSQPNYDYEKIWCRYGTKAPNGDLWYLNYEGAIQVSGANIITYDIDNLVKAKSITSPMDILFYNKDTVIFATWAGLVFLNTTTKQATNIVYKNKLGQKSNLYCITSLDKNNILVGSDDGVLQYNCITKKIELLHINLTTKQPEELNKIRQFVKIDNNIFVGTKDGLLQYNTQAKNFTRIGYDKGIDRIDNYNLLLDKNKKLWIYTTHNLYSYNTITKTIQQFDKKDGILSFTDDPAVLFEYNNLFYIGYRHAFTCFDPLNTNIKIPITTPIIENVFVNKQAFLLSSPATFKHNQNEIQFNYTSPNYAFADKITFKVMLVGFDDVWREQGTLRTITYSNLSPGTYTFKVICSNNEGKTSDTIAVYTFTIKPAYWQTWWFKFLCFATIALAIYYLYKNRIKNIAQQAQYAQQLSELEMQNLRAKMNPHFIFNSLQSIQNYIWDNRNQDAADYLVKFSKLIRNILEQSSEKTIALQLEIETLQLYLDLEYRRANPKFEYSIDKQNTINTNLKIPPLILQPFVENAIWHGLRALEDRVGKITITFNIENNMLLCTVMDNGIGRSKSTSANATQKQSLGIAITKKRLQQFALKNIEQLVYKDLAQGTTVTIKLPLIYE